MKTPFLLCIASTLVFASCGINLDVFEKNVSVPNQQWESSFRPEINFDISDTTALYNIFLVIRHTDAYHFNNIWVKAQVQQPGETAFKARQYDLPLATNDRGWLGSAMDDIYEQRVLIQPQTKFSKPGEYRFRLEEIMREDPLKQILNVGVRVEKVK